MKLTLLFSASIIVIAGDTPARRLRIASVVDRRRIRSIVSHDRENTRRMLEKRRYENYGSRSMPRERAVQTRFAQSTSELSAKTSRDDHQGRVQPQR